MTIFDLHPDRVTHWARHAWGIANGLVRRLVQQVRDRWEAARLDQSYRLAASGAEDLSRFVLTMVLPCMLIAVLMCFVLALVIMTYAPIGQGPFHAMGFPT